MQPVATIARYGRAAPITPSDTTTHQPATGGQIQSLYIGGAGNVAVRTLDGTIVTFTAVPVGTILPVQCDRVMATNTTATLIIALR